MARATPAAPSEASNAMATSSITNSGESRVIEARIRRPFRIALNMLVLIAFVIPVIESIFVKSATGAFAIRSIDFIALATMFVSFPKPYLLNQRMNKIAGL
ncbi:hypothetical protein PSCICL_47700 [Pseudomonas cichorii]|nr:hypothetical protein PSCICL_47700 [Pseudomonas cichorii]